MDDMDAVFAGTKPGYVYSHYASPTVTLSRRRLPAWKEPKLRRRMVAAWLPSTAVLLAAGTRVGIPDGLVRLSVGSEAAEDILADLDQALGKI
jgi:O-acetylhomoserine/O-acetylserine sulfhydrylase-like pyridoxal-dependent enzyme